MFAGIKRTNLLCQSRNTAVQSFIVLALVDAFPMMSVKAVLILSGAGCIKLLIKKPGTVFAMLHFLRKFMGSIH